MRRIFLLFFIIISFVLTNCGGNSNPVSPTNVQRNLANKPTTPPDQKKFFKISGKILNKLTKKPIEKAIILLHVLQSSQLPTNQVLPTTTQSPTTLPTSVPSPTTTPTTNPSPTTTPTSTLKSKIEHPQKYSFLIEENQEEINLPEPYHTTSNNSGKFWFNSIPEGIIILTVTAPGYRTLTISDIDPSQTQTIYLTPLNQDSNLSEISGMVMSVNNKPVNSAIVSPSFIVGETIGIPVFTNSIGEYTLKDISIGKHTLLALETNENGKITAWGLLEDVSVFKIKKDKKSEKTKKTIPIEEVDRPGLEYVDSKEKDKKSENEEEVIKKSQVESPLPEFPTSKSSESPTKLIPSIKPLKKSLPSPKDIEPLDKPLDKTLKSNLSTKKTNTLSDSSEIKTDLPKSSKKTPKPSESTKKRDGIVDWLGGLLPNSDKTNEKSKYHVIIIRSVTETISLKGKVNLPDEKFKLRDITVYLTLKKQKKDEVQEILVTNTKLNPKSKNFEIELPVPPEETSYHIQISAVDSNGFSSYSHIFGIKESSDKIDVTMLSPPSDLKLKDENLVFQNPTFTWQPVPNSIYKVSLEKEEKDDKVETIWEAWTLVTEIKYPIEFGLGKLSVREEYKWNVTAITGLQDVNTNIEVPISGKLQYEVLKNSLWKNSASTKTKKFVITKKTPGKFDKNNDKDEI